MGRKMKLIEPIEAELSDVADCLVKDGLPTELPKAEYTGEIELGNTSIECAVLGDGTRVISQASFLRTLGRSRSPKKGTGVISSVDKLPFFLQAKSLSPFIPEDLEVSTQPIEYITKSGGKKVGYNAFLLPKTAEVYLKYRDHCLATKGKVPANQSKMVAAADILIRGLAHVGIAAIVDEATGYQDVRAKNALAKILEQYLDNELQKWTKTFPDEFYKEIFRLNKWKWNPFTVKRPGVIGKWTNEFVYERLAPGVLDELKEKNPKDAKGRRPAKHHQWFNTEFGHPKLKEHIAGVLALMRASTNWKGFKSAMERAYPKHGNQLQLPIEYDD